MNDDPQQPQKLGAMIDVFTELREQHREQNKVLKQIKDDMDELEEKILALLHEQGLDLGRGHTATASVSTNTVGTVVDWDAFGSYVMQNQALHLLERRVSSAAWRELFQAGEIVPGTEPYIKTTLNVRKLNRK